MTLDDVYKLGSIVSSLVVPLLLWQIVLFRRQIAMNQEQIRLMQQTMQATLDGQIYARLDTINELVIGEKGLYGKLFESYKGGDALHTEVTRYLVDMALTFFEHVHNQRFKYKMMDDAEWQAWVSTMRNVLSLPYVKGYWQQSAGERYPGDFAHKSTAS